MDSERRSVCIVMADDDPDDRELAREAIVASRLRNPLYFVEDGEELLDFLNRRGKYSVGTAPRPGLILLDLNMPRMDGREALRAIKADPILRAIPTVVLTTSNADVDVLSCYLLGANSFITKPVTFDRLVEVMRALGAYWFDTVALPAGTTATTKA